MDVPRLERALETAGQVLAETGRELVRADRARAVCAVHDLIGQGLGRVGTARVANLIEAFAESRSAQDREDGREREARSETFGGEEVRADEKESIDAGASPGRSTERLLFTGLPHRVEWCQHGRGSTREGHNEEQATP